MADWNGDGLDDVFISRHGGTTHLDHWWLQQSDGTHHAGPSLPAVDRHGCDAGDVNGDGLLDMYCQTGSSYGDGDTPSELWLQQPDGSVIDAAAAWGVDDPFGRGRRPVIDDFDDDGLDDIYLTNWAVPRPDGERNDNRLLLSTGTGMVESFTSVTGKRGARCVATGDWNGDGLVDIATCGNDLELHVNHGGGRFQDVTHLLGDNRVTWPRDAQLDDVDGDGRDDLVVVGRSRLQVRLNRAPAGVKFSIVHRSWGHVAGARVAVHDLDDNGRQDVYLLQGLHDGRNWPDLTFDAARWKRPGSMVARGVGGQAVPSDLGLVVTHGGAAGDIGPVQIR